MKSIAWLGTGLMGAPMARNLLKAGFDVTVWNRDELKADALLRDGATVAGSPAHAVKEADIVVTMLTAGPAVESVLFDSGLDKALKPGAIVVDMSSIEPARARDHAERLKKLGFEYLDAPVSGGTKGAADASLAIMVGGERAAFEAAEPMFEAMGRPTRVGPAGCGQLSKLANQSIVAITIGAVSEALLLAAAGGADPAAVRKALSGGFADSRILQEHGKRMLERNFVPGGKSHMQVKDLHNLRTAADDLGVTLPVSGKVTELFESLVNGPGAEYDHSALLLELESMNKPHRVGEIKDRLPE